MKNLNKLSLIIALLLFTSISSAQERVNKGDATINIRITSSMSSGSDFINIYKRGTTVEIIHRKFNRIDFENVRVDTAYTNINFDPNVIDPQKLNKLRPIFDRHSVYDTTKVVINLKTDTAYQKILQLVAQSGKQELETSKVGERLILDGFGFSGEIITNSDIKNISMRSPDAKSHPIVAALLEESYNRLWKTRRK